MDRKDLSPYLALLFRWVLGIIFIYASINKILYPDLFAKAVANYQLLPNEMINIFAIILPWLEFLTGAGLILGIWVKPCAIWISFLLFIFSLALSISLFRGLNISCGCFEFTRETKIIGVTTIVRDISLFLIALYVAFFDKKLLSIR
ncbi:MAG: DoxX family membrane protein [Deltaproteobacteria bacterium]|nr:DoxX family membrane protein [Deltaproteobacteria bacterium]